MGPGTDERATGRQEDGYEEQPAEPEHGAHRRAGGDATGDEPVRGPGVEGVRRGGDQAQTDAEQRGRHGPRARVVVGLGGLGDAQQGGAEQAEGGGELPAPGE